MPSRVSISPHEFAIPTRDLDAAGKAFSFPVRAAWMRGALEATDVGPDRDDGELEVRASRTGNDVLVRGTLRARVVVPCARCLDPAHIAIDETVTALAVPAPLAPPAAKRAHGAGGQDDETDGDLTDAADAIAFDGETVVLDGLVRDELLLAVPMIPLCSPSCTGISIGSQTGEGRPGDGRADDGVGGPRVDPRLSPLLRLKKT